MRKITLLAVLLALFILIVIGIFLYSGFVQKNLTGKVVNEYTHSYTKAICNETHCQDYEIVCKGNETISKTPITGMVPHNTDWKDPRDEKARNSFCN